MTRKDFVFHHIDLKQLENNLWFSQLPEKFQNFIFEKSIQQCYQKDQAIFRSGDPFNGIYAVVKGNVRLGHLNLEGHETIAAIVEPIMWFGEISLVDDQPRSHDAICMTETYILYLPATEIQLFLSEYPAYWYHIAQLTTQKLRFAFLELLSIQSQNIQQRVAQRLLFILNGYGNHVNIEQSCVHLSQEQLAQLLRCSRQTINHELGLLEELGIIRVAFKKVEILDLTKLHQLAHHI